MPETGPRVGVIIPAYDNAATVRDVVLGALASGLPVLAIDDGSRDGTAGRLAGIDGLAVVIRPVNEGKGAALLFGMREGARRGWTHAVTLDADGQHDPRDIPRLVEDVAAGDVRIGWRATLAENPNVPARCRLGRAVSNFAFRLLTGRRSRDTQSGFRVYPIARVEALHVRPARYETEFELLVRLAWAGARIVEIPIHAHYPPPAERISHFRPLRDCARIVLAALALLLVRLLGHTQVGAAASSARKRRKPGHGSGPACEPVTDRPYTAGRVTDQ